MHRPRCQTGFSSTSAQLAVIDRYRSRRCCSITMREPKMAASYSVDTAMRMARSWILAWPSPSIAMGRALSLFNSPAAG